MIKGKNIEKSLKEKLAKGYTLEKAIFEVAKEKLLSLLPSQRDWETIAKVVNACQYYAHEIHPEFRTSREVSEEIKGRIWRYLNPTD